MSTCVCIYDFGGSLMNLACFQAKSNEIGWRGWLGSRNTVFVYRLLGLRDPRQLEIDRVESRGKTCNLCGNSVLWGCCIISRMTKLKRVSKLIQSLARHFFPTSVCFCRKQVINGWHFPWRSLLGHKESCVFVHGDACAVKWVRSSKHFNFIWVRVDRLDRGRS